MAVTPWSHVVLEAERNGRRLVGEVGLIIRFLDEGFAHQITFSSGNAASSDLS
jgi:hypothetical protein